MNEYIPIMMEMIRREVDGEAPDAADFFRLSEEDQRKMARLAKKNSVGQLLGDALGKVPEASKLTAAQELVSCAFVALQQTSGIERERKRICALLEQEQIPYIQLKGSRLRGLYPESWMRTSCDIDILVPETQLERTASLLTEKLDYERGEKSAHDISMFSRRKVHLELHFSILGNDEKMNRVLNRVWEPDFVSAVPGRSEWLQTVEFFVFYHLAHMANHFVAGGCGIRPFLDLYLLRKKLPFSVEQTEALCCAAGIGQFCRNVWKLVDVWFCGRPHTDATRRMEEFVLTGGIYGNRKNRLAVNERKTGSRRMYLLRRIFLSPQALERKYPAMNERRYLVPLYEVKHWISAFTKEKQGHIRRDLNLIRDMDNDSAAEVQRMLEENGLI